MGEKGWRNNGSTRKKTLLCTHVLIKVARRSRQSHYLAGVRDVIVVVVDDRCPLLIELDPTLTAQLSQGVTCRDTEDSLSQVTETQK